MRLKLTSFLTLRYCFFFANWLIIELSLNEVLGDNKYVIGGNYEKNFSLSGFINDRIVR